MAHINQLVQFKSSLRLTSFKPALSLGVVEALCNRTTGPGRGGKYNSGDQMNLSEYTLFDSRTLLPLGHT